MIKTHEIKKIQDKVNQATQLLLEVQQLLENIETERQPLPQSLTTK